MNTEKLYHYVYRITNTVLNKHYYGKRSSNIEPKLDLGIRYFSSSKDKKFITDQKVNIQNYKYKVIVICKTSDKALSYEVKLHNIFNVAVNTSFYNKAKQTSTKFTTSGKCYRKNYRHSKGTIEKLRKASTGYRHTEESKAKMSKSKKGLFEGNKHPNAKYCNIYEYSTNKLLVENVVLKQWCRENNYNQGAMSLTLKADLTSKSSRSNHHHHKGLYARYAK